MYDSNGVIELIETRFPQLSEELRDGTWDGLLHVQMGVFSRFAQSAIDDGEKDAWKEISRVFLEIRHDCTPEVGNALSVAFLEHLNFADQKKKRSWAYRSMHPEMRKAWDEIREYNRKLRSCSRR